MPIGYRFASLPGRLMASSSRTAYNPQAFRAVEVSPVTRMSGLERPVAVRTVAGMSTPMKTFEPIPQEEMHGVFPDTPEYRKFQEKQRFMSEPDQVFVWEKLPLYKREYQFTVLFTLVGTLMLGQFCYKMAYGGKKED